MRYCLLTAFFALLIFACGEVSGGYPHGEGGSASVLCGTEKYDPKESFCFEDKFYLLCGGKEYDPIAEFCFEDKHYFRCGGKEMNPLDQFCFDGKPYPKCKGKNYNPSEQFCWADSLVTTCGGLPYDLNKEFCSDFVIYPVCGSERVPFDPKVQSCLPMIDDPARDMLYFICGQVKDEYSQSKECTSPRYKVCGERKMFVPDQEFCKDNGVYPLCGPDKKSYDPSAEFCGLTNTVLSMCNTKPCGETMTGITQYCPEPFDDVNFECVGGNQLREKIYVPPPVIDSCMVKDKIWDKDKAVYKDTVKIKSYDPKTDFCENEACIDSTKYGVKRKPSESVCKTNKLYPICGSLKLKPDVCCNGVRYDKSTQFCFKDELYPNCNRKSMIIDIPNPANPTKENPPRPDSTFYPYNPLDSGCFSDGRLYPNCTNENSRGTCVHNSLLRCRQEGKGDDHIRDPLPGMKCVDDDASKISLHANIGAIVGWARINNGKDSVGVAQIGRQIWMRENANGGKFYSWAEANALSMICNSSIQNSECNPTKGNELHQAVCPLGFYIARDDDWNELMTYAGGASVAGGRLKDSTGWSNNGNGTNNYGFNAKPYGYYEGLLLTGESNPVEKDKRSMWWSENSTAGTVSGSYWTIISKDTELRHALQPKGLLPQPNDTVSSNSQLKLTPPKGYISLVQTSKSEDWPRVDGSVKNGDLLSYKGNETIDTIKVEGKKDSLVYKNGWENLGSFNASLDFRAQVRCLYYYNRVD